MNTKFTSYFFGTLALLGLLSGCATYLGAESKHNIQKLEAGMGEHQVLNLLGTPDQVLHPDSMTDRWVYEFKKTDKKGHNLFVEFVNGEFKKSGELSGRDVAAAGESGTPGNCTKWKNPEFTEESICTR